MYGRKLVSISWNVLFMSGGLIIAGGGKVTKIAKLIYFIDWSEASECCV